MTVRIEICFPCAKQDHAKLFDEKSSQQPVSQKSTTKESKVNESKKLSLKVSKSKGNGNSCFKTSKTKKKKEHILQSGGPKQLALGDPKLRKASGRYIFKVSSFVRNGDVYSYKLLGGKGQLYEVDSKVLIPIGAMVDCNVKVTTHGVSIMSLNRFRAENSTNFIKLPHIREVQCLKSSRSFEMPKTRNYFHLIYTPMGNKR